MSGERRTAISPDRFEKQTPRSPPRPRDDKSLRPSRCCGFWLGLWP